MSTETPDAADTASAAVQPPQPATMAERLTHRLNATAQPSLLINELHAAHGRCVQARRTLLRLCDKAPRIQREVRGILRQAFALDPHTLLFSEPGPPPRVDTLTERSLATLNDCVDAQPLNLLTCLSIPGGAHAILSMTPADVLQRVRAERLLARIETAHTHYWQGLADGSWRTRRDNWVEAYQVFFAEKAFLAHQLYELSDDGLSMALGIVDAPTVQQRELAGGDWAALQVSELVWPGNGSTPVPISGAVHLSRKGADGAGRQVVFVPGLRQEFHEFDSWAQMQLNLAQALNGEVDGSLWQRMPLRRRHELYAKAPVPFSVVQGPAITEDALRHVALTALDTQWDNELACVRGVNVALAFAAGVEQPDSIAARLSQLERSRYRVVQYPALRSLLDRLLRWDLRRRRDEINFAQLRPDMAFLDRENRLKHYQRAVLALLRSEDLAEESAAFSDFLASSQRRQRHIDEVERLLENQQAEFQAKAFWVDRNADGKNRLSRMLRARRAAWLEEATMQQALQLIGQPERQALIEALQIPMVKNPGNSQVRVLTLSLGSVPLTAAFVVTTAAGWAAPALRQPALLLIDGAHGGLQGFRSLKALSAGLQVSLRCVDGSPLWSCISRQHREQARQGVRALSPGQPLPLHFALQEGSALFTGFNDQIKDYSQTLRWVDAGGRPFSEVSDVALTKELLAEEMLERLTLAKNPTRELTLVNVEIVRLAAGYAKNRPEWLTGASAAMGQRYANALRRHLSSAHACDERLMEALPDLGSFARQRLSEQLERDGLYPEIDIDRPAFDIPDSVHTVWESHPARPIGGSGPKVVVSPQRTTFSLLQLALHNLDADAPWTPLMMQRTRYLVPGWKERLSPDYLIKTLSALDLGGAYEKLIVDTFSSRGNARFPLALMWRTQKNRGQLDLISAQLQGMDARAQSMFATALAARSLQDLHKNDHQLSLCVVSVHGRTLQQPRHVAGLLVICDNRSGLCLVYWPDAKGHPALTMHADMAEARRALMTTAGLPANLPELAKKIAPGWEDEALQSYPAVLEKTPVPQSPSKRFRFAARVASELGLFTPLNLIPILFSVWFFPRKAVPALSLEEIEQELREQIAEDADGWLRITPTNGHDLLSILAHAQVLWIQGQARAMANSAEALRQYRERRLGEQASTSLRRALALIPLVSIGVNLYEVMLAIRRLYHNPGAEEVLELVYAIHTLVVDVAMTLFPLGKVAAAGSGVLKVQGLYRGGLKLAILQHVVRSSGLARPLQSLLGRAIKGLETYQLKNISSGGVTLHGPVNRGAYALNNRVLVSDGTRVYPVYRRRNEATLRLKNQHDEGQNELILHIQESGEVLLKADAPPAAPSVGERMWRPWSDESLSGPQPGPSSAVARVPPARSSHPGLSQPSGASSVAVAPVYAVDAVQGLEMVLRQPRLETFNAQLAPAWKAVPQPGPDQVTALSKRAFKVEGERSYQAVKVEGEYFEILPNGPGTSEQVAFLHKGTSLAAGPEIDIFRWLGADLAEQPIPVSFDKTGRATPRRAMFHEPLEVSIDRAFPGMTGNARRVVGARLVEAAGPRGPATATHLLNLRAVLDRWLDSGGPASTDDLFSMLAPLERAPGHKSIYIDHARSSSGFGRVDFVHNPDIYTQLSGQPMVARGDVIYQALSSVLERQGFVIGRSRGKEGSAIGNLICTHPASDKVYFVLGKWGEGPSVALQGRGRVILSDNWIDHYFSQPTERRYRRLVAAAQNDGRLVKLIGGLQYHRASHTSTVYFVKVREP